MNMVCAVRKIAAGALVVLLAGGSVGLTASGASAAAVPTIIDLGALSGDTGSQATAVSGTIVVGQSSRATNLPSGAGDAFAYNLGAASPAMIDLGALGGRSFATAVSGNIVVGSTGASPVPFAYDLGAASPTMIDLGTLGGASSYAAAVSGNIVVGFAATTSGPSYATAWLLSTGGNPLPVSTVGMIGVAALAGCGLFITQRRQRNRHSA